MKALLGRSTKSARRERRQTWTTGDTGKEDTKCDKDKQLACTSENHGWLAMSLFSDQVRFHWEMSLERDPWSAPTSHSTVFHPSVWRGSCPQVLKLWALTNAKKASLTTLVVPTRCLRKLASGFGSRFAPLLKGLCRRGNNIYTEILT